MKIDLISITGERPNKGLWEPLAKEEPGKDFSSLLSAKLGKDASPPPQAKETVHEYTVKPGDTLWKIGVKRFQIDPLKIAKDNGIARADRIYAGQKLKIYKPQGIPPQEVVASWYGKDYHNKPTASGEKFNMYKNTLAHKNLPLGTKVRLTNMENGRTAVAKINDRGPFIKGRDVDLSFALAKQLGLIKKGVGKLVMEIL